MADFQKVQEGLEAKVTTPSSPRGKQDLGDFIRRISNRPEMKATTNEEMVAGIYKYLKDKGMLEGQKIKAIPEAKDYDAVVITVQRQVLQQKRDVERAKVEQVTTARLAEQGRAHQAQRERLLETEQGGRTALEAEAAQLEAMHASFEAQRVKLVEAESLRAKAQQENEELQRRTLQIEAGAQHNHPSSLSMATLRQEGEAIEKQRQATKRYEQKKQTQAMIEALVSRAAKKGKEAGEAKRAELQEKHKDILSIPDMKVAATAQQVETAQRLAAEHQETQQRAATLSEQDKVKQEAITKARLEEKRQQVKDRTERTTVVQDASREKTTVGEQGLADFTALFEDFKVRTERLQHEQTVQKEAAERAALVTQASRTMTDAANQAMAESTALLQTFKATTEQLQQDQTARANAEREEAAKKEAVAQAKRNDDAKKAEQRRQVGITKLAQAADDMQQSLKINVSSGKSFGMFGGYEAKRDAAIDRLVGSYCESLRQHQPSLEALSMDKEKENMVRHNVAQMKTKIDSFCQEYKNDSPENFNQNLDTWAKKEAKELADKSKALMSEGFKANYPALPASREAALPNLESTFQNTEAPTSHNVTAPSTSIVPKHSSKQQPGR